MEGTPIQEVAALEVNCNTNAIIDVFLAYPHTEKLDDFARDHSHGLNKAHLKVHGFPSKDSLLMTLKMWLMGKPYVGIFQMIVKRK